MAGTLTQDKIKNVFQKLVFYLNSKLYYTRSDNSTDDLVTSIDNNISFGGALTGASFDAKQDNLGSDELEHIANLSSDNTAGCNGDQNISGILTNSVQSLENLASINAINALAGGNTLVQGFSDNAFRVYLPSDGWALFCLVSCNTVAVGSDLLDYTVRMVFKAGTHYSQLELLGSGTGYASATAELGGGGVYFLFTGIANKTLLWADLAGGKNISIESVIYAP